VDLVVIVKVDSRVLLVGVVKQARFQTRVGGHFTVKAALVGAGAAR